MLQLIGIVAVMAILLAVIVYVIAASRLAPRGTAASVDSLATLEQTADLAREKSRLETDLAEHHRIEDELRHARDRYEVLVENANDVVIIAQDGVMKFANRRTEEMLGYTQAELADIPFTDLIVPEDQQMVLDRYRRRLRGEEVPNRYNFRIHSKSGDISWVEINTVTVNWEGRLATLSFLRDVSDQVRAEERIREARRAAELANQAKGRFLANMSHELRTPMNGVIGLTELALSTELNDEQRRYLSGVVESGEFMLSLINTILDFSKIEAGKLSLNPVEFRLRGELSDTMKIVAMRAAEKGLELACDVRPDVPDYLQGDAPRLRQVLFNLVGNAVKFTDRGEIVLMVELADSQADELTLRFTIRDTGIGIPVEKQQFIFEPFAQADESVTRQYGGTGLGLAICHQLVALMGGEIAVLSQAGQGSSFVFTAQLRTFAHADQAPDCPVAAGANVLVVEGHAATREAIRDMLLAWELAPTVTGSVVEAAKLLDERFEQQQPFAYLILDDALDHETNGRFRRRLNQLSPTTRLIVVSGHHAARTGLPDREGASAAHSHVTRPVMPSDLLEAIQQASDDRQRATSSPAAIVVEHASQPLRVLLVEDNVINQRVATSWLQKRGHSVTLAISGEAALDLLEPGAFDLALMDLEMPGAGGLATTVEIRRRESESGGHLPIVAMTAHALAGDRERCISAGMDDYLSKPIRPNELFHVIERFAAQPNPATEQRAGDLAPEPAPTPVAVAAPGNGFAFDLAAALATAGGDAQLLRELIEIFLADSPGWIQDLQAALEAGNCELARRLAHSLKNSAGYFGAAPIRKLASDLEQAAARGDLESARNLMSGVLVENSRLAPELVRCREELSTTS